VCVCLCVCVCLSVCLSVCQCENRVFAIGNDALFLYMYWAILYKESSADIWSLSVCVCVCMCVCLRACVCVCVCVCAYVCRALLYKKRAAQVLGVKSNEPLINTVQKSP